MSKLKALWVVLCLISSWAYVQADDLVGLSTSDVKQLRQEGYVLVDIRTPAEWKQTGLIEGSYPLTAFDDAGHFDADRWISELLRVDGGQKDHIILICRSGHRSALAGKALLASQKLSKVYHLEKGIRGWSADGNPLTPCKNC